MPENRLIAALPRLDRQQLLAQCRRVDLVAAQVLSEHGEPMRQVVFPIDGVLVLMARALAASGSAAPPDPAQDAAAADTPHTVAVALIGREGVLGSPVLLAPPRPPRAAASEVPSAGLRVLVRTPGASWQVDGADMRRLLATSAPLRGLFAAQVLALLGTLAAAAACAHFHQLEPRLARWLLLCHDRAGNDSFQLTQAQLAVLLGVRRVGVTVAAGQLQRRGLIGYHRGQVSVLDRTGLEAASCACHRTDLATPRG